MIDPVDFDYTKIVKQLLRFLKLEKLMPSYRCVLSQACLDCLANLQLNKKIENDLETFYAFAAYGHYEEVRVKAVNILLHLAPNDVKTYVFLVNLLKTETSCFMRRKIVELWVNLPFEELAAKPMFDDNVQFCEGMWELLKYVMVMS
jgi:transcription initiation factor TFIID subunit 2